jgi:cbb3-type cytochrome oxidase cytochrome c subunit
MNYGPLLFLAAFFALASSWFGFVLSPQLQIGSLRQTNAVPAGEAYPVARPGLARQGLDVYRANGCAYCHSEQVGQTGIVCDVLLTDAGTNRPVLIAALLKVKPQAQPDELLASLPATVGEGLTKTEADAIAKSLSVGGAKAQAWIRPIGPDIDRGWGKRRSVAEDFLYDYPVMPGSQRIGPDLANVGVRLPDANWQLLHLYAPTNKVPGSAMPPYRYLFEKRRIERAPSPGALDMPPELAPQPGYEIVPKAEARALVAYLLSLRSDLPLFNAPVSVAPPAPPSTNAPPK